MMGPRAREGRAVSYRGRHQLVPAASEGQQGALAAEVVLVAGCRLVEAVKRAVRLKVAEAQAVLKVAAAPAGRAVPLRAR